MKICWDNLEKLRYSKKTGKFYQGQATYIFSENNCLNCNKNYLQNCNSKFCSVQCSNGWLKKHKKEIKCLYCNKSFKIINYYVDKRKFCCKKCSQLYSKGENHPLYGKKHSLISKEKMSKSHTGKKLSLEHKKNIGKASSIRRMPLISKEKMSKSHLKRIKKYGHWTQTKNGKKILSERASLNIGCKNPNWHGGISWEPYCSVWSDKEYKESIKARDRYKCQNPSCNEKSKRLSIHHINYIKKDCGPNNLITLCVSCNAKANFNRDSWKKFYNYIIYYNLL